MGDGRRGTRGATFLSAVWLPQTQVASQVASFCPVWRASLFSQLPTGPCPKLGPGPESPVRNWLFRARADAAGGLTVEPSDLRVSTN